MPIIFKNEDSKIGFQLGQRSAHRSTYELVDQLTDQIKAERAQAAARLAEKQRELTVALRDLAELRYELAKRDRPTCRVQARPYIEARTNCLKDRSRRPKLPIRCERR
jgi:hypothetical protein